MAQNIKIDDKVKVIAGDHKGTEAKVVKVNRKAGKACLEGIGLVERHLKKSYLNPAGGKKTIHVGIDFSNLKVIESAKFEKGKKTSEKNAKAKKGAK